MYRLIERYRTSSFNYLETNYLEEILLVTMYCPGKIRRYNGTAVMTIKESMNIAKIKVLFRRNR
jgi:hypothetical protein